MKYCYACGRMTGGEPLFCNFCGRSYDVKLCPKLHMNARLAEACSRCGSRDLSIPQPKVPLSWRMLALLAQGLSGLFLVFISLPSVIRLVTALLTRSDIRKPLTVVVCLALPSWVLWVLLPMFVRRVIHRALVGRGDMK